MGSNRGRVLAANRVLRGVVLLCALVGAGVSHAFVDVTGGYTHSYSGGRTSVNAPVANGNWSTSISGGNIRASRSGNVAAPGGRTVPVTMGKNIPLSLAKKHLFKALPFIGTGVALYELWEALGVHCSGVDNCEADAGVAATTTTGYTALTYGGTTHFATTAVAACAAISQANGVSFGLGAMYVGTYTFSSPYLSGGYCRGVGSGGFDFNIGTYSGPTSSSACTGGVAPRPDGMCNGGVVSPLTEAEAEELLDYMSATDTRPYLDQALDVLPMAIPQPVEISEPIPDVSGPTTTTTGPGGTTTKETHWEGDVPPSETDVIDWEEETVTTNPDGSTETETTDDPLDDGPPEQKDFCLENPGRVGCMEGGEADDVDIPNQDVNVAITPVTFGANDASCPSDAPMVTSWGTYYFKYDGMCMVAQGIRPIVLAMAWLAAAFILVGARSDD